MAKRLLGSVLASLLSSSLGFVNLQHARSASHTLVFGVGEGINLDTPLDTSYGARALNPIKDLIDTESAMKEFFSSNEDWKPLFSSIVEGASVPAMSFIGDADNDDFKFDETTSPWKRFDAIPTGDADRAVLADFLNNMETALLEIPVNEAIEEDENDLHFVEEGRRLLVCSRFHVILGAQKGSIQSFDTLFSTCWSEIKHLRQEDEPDTGSIIVVPGVDIADLRRFADMNLQRPLEWLGIDSFEVASMDKGSPAIRLIHKISDIPTDVGEPPEEEPEE